MKSIILYVAISVIGGKNPPPLIVSNLRKNLMEKNRITEIKYMYVSALDLTLSRGKTKGKR